jgi:hypothetical protein
MPHDKGTQKEDKINAPSSPKYITNNKDTLSSDDNASSDDDDSLSSDL